MTSANILTESTLREGEQFANAYFDLEAKIKIARALDDFGVDCTVLLHGTRHAQISRLTPVCRH
jgi:isopropylmalate/homocitrate/citramalate synthase